MNATRFKDMVKSVDKQVPHLTQRKEIYRELANTLNDIRNLEAKALCEIRELKNMLRQYQPKSEIRKKRSEIIHITNVGLTRMSKVNKTANEYNVDPIFKLPPRFSTHAAMQNQFLNEAEEYDNAINDKVYDHTTKIPSEDLTIRIDWKYIGAFIPSYEIREMMRNYPNEDMGDNQDTPTEQLAEKDATAELAKKTPTENSNIEQTKATTKEPIEGPVKKTVTEPVKEPIKEPAKEEPAKEEPAKEEKTKPHRYGSIEEIWESVLKTGNKDGQDPPGDGGPGGHDDLEH